jgi:hypothetical protein
LNDTRPLGALRGLPHLLARRPGFRPAGSAPVLDAFLKVGFILLGERPDAELAADVVGRFWRLADSEAASGRTREGASSPSPSRPMERSSRPRLRRQKAPELGQWSWVTEGTRTPDLRDHNPNLGSALAQLREAEGQRPAVSPNRGRLLVTAHARARPLRHGPRADRVHRAPAGR